MMILVSVSDAKNDSLVALLVCVCERERIVLVNFIKRAYSRSILFCETVVLGRHGK